MVTVPVSCNMRYLRSIIKYKLRYVILIVYISILLRDCNTLENKVGGEVRGERERDDVNWYARVWWRRERGKVREGMP